jgi:hypothetical protein
MIRAHRKHIVAHQKPADDDVMQIRGKDQSNPRHQKAAGHHGGAFERPELRPEGVGETRDDADLIPGELQRRQKNARRQPDPETDRDLHPQQDKKPDRRAEGDRAHRRHRL